MRDNTNTKKMKVWLREGQVNCYDCEGNFVPEKKTFSKLGLVYCTCEDCGCRGAIGQSYRDKDYTVYREF